MDDDGLVPDALRARARRGGPRGQAGQVPLHGPELPQPGRRHPRTVAASGDPRRSRSAPACSSSRTTRTACSASTGSCPQALRAADADGVVYLGSFSKTFAAGLRVGWAVAPHAVREKLVLAAEASVLCPSAFSQLTVSTYLATEPWLDQVKIFRELYRERRDACWTRSRR